MTKAATYQCPNCDGVVAFNAESGQLECEYCGSTFLEGELDQAMPVNAEAEIMDAPHVKTVDEFLDNAPWEITHEGTAAAATTVQYSCPSCGAGIIADQSTISTSCPYCGNNMFVAGIATADTLPERILPFSITREQAQANMRRHFEHKWYLSRKFDAQLEHIQPVYVPYHLYDVDVSGRADYIAYDRVDNGKNNSYYYYAFKRAGHAAFRQIPVDGSSKMPDAHMDAIAPFDFSAMRPFSPEYAAGFLMEVADEGIAQRQPRAEALARASFEEDMKQDVLDEPKIDGISETVSQETDVRTVQATSCVLPVWLMHCTWDNNQMLFAVNGETGKCVGDLPISSIRRGLTVFTLVVVLAIAAFFLLGAMSEGWREIGNISEIAIAAIVAVALIPIAVDGHFKKQMRTAVEATDAGLSYSSEGLVITDRWRTEKRYGTKKKALRKLEEKNAGAIE